MSNYVVSADKEDSNGQRIAIFRKIQAVNHEEAVRIFVASQGIDLIGIEVQEVKQ